MILHHFVKTIVNFISCLIFIRETKYPARCSESLNLIKRIKSRQLTRKCWRRVNLFRTDGRCLLDFGVLARVRERMGLPKPPGPSTTNPPGSVKLGFSLLATARQKNAIVEPSGAHTALRLAALGATPGSVATARPD